MPATAQSPKPKSDPMELYRLRDELAETHHPANAHERMLVTQIAQAWLRLQRAIDIEQRFFENNDVMEVISTKLSQFQAVTRFTTECDRAWRQAVALLKSAQRDRRRADLSPPKAPRVPYVATRPLTLTPPDAPCPVDSNIPQRRE